MSDRCKWKKFLRATPGIITGATWIFVIPSQIEEAAVWWESTIGKYGKSWGNIFRLEDIGTYSIWTAATLTIICMVFYFPPRWLKSRVAIRQDHIGQERALRRAALAPESGEFIAKLISEQPNSELALPIFDIFRATPNKIDEAFPYAAFASLLMRENRSTVAQAVLLEIPDHISHEDRNSALDIYFLNEGDIKD